LGRFALVDSFCHLVFSVGHMASLFDVAYDASNSARGTSLKHRSSSSSSNSPMES